MKNNYDRMRPNIDELIKELKKVAEFNYIGKEYQLSWIEARTLINQIDQLEKDAEFYRKKLNNDS